MIMSRDVVLLLTHSGDFFTVDRVADGVVRRGRRAIRVDTDRYPASVGISSRNGSAVLRIDGEAIGDDRVRGIWLRRIFGAPPDPEMDPQFAAECAAESRAALHGFLDSLHAASWVDPLERVRAAENKLRQLRLAAAAGLMVPRTIVTNDATDARGFYEELGGRVVAKLLRPLTLSMGAPARAVYTSQVRAEDVEEMDSLALCPMVFQERIPVARELRVAYVDGRCFAGAIDVAADADGEPDWRRARGQRAAWAHGRLEAATEGAIGRLMRRLGLRYGALDVIQAPDGREVFLEVNPSGEWGMLEKELDLPIGDAIAAALVEGDGSNAEGDER
jgi:glutathione synthase/RimK-type ligase-like ATP-grasp enzyme